MRFKPMAFLLARHELYHCATTTDLRLTIAPYFQGIIERDISVIRKESEIASLSTELSGTKAELTAARKTIFSLQVTNLASVVY